VQFMLLFCSLQAQELDKVDPVCFVVRYYETVALPTFCFVNIFICVMNFSLFCSALSRAVSCVCYCQ